jgi:hypothetical protein
MSFSRLFHILKAKVMQPRKIDLLLLCILDYSRFILWGLCVKSNVVESLTIPLGVCSPRPTYIGYYRENLLGVALRCWLEIMVNFEFRGKIIISAIPFLFISQVLILLVQERILIYICAQCTQRIDEVD